MYFGLKLLHCKEISNEKTRLECLNNNNNNKKNGDFGIFEFNGEKLLIFGKIWIFQHNSAPNYFSVRKFHMRRLNLNAKKQLIFKFSILSGKIAKFKKIGFLSFIEKVN